MDGGGECNAWEFAIRVADQHNGIVPAALAMVECLNVTGDVIARVSLGSWVDEQSAQCDMMSPAVILACHNMTVLARHIILLYNYICRARTTATPHFANQTSARVW